MLYNFLDNTEKRQVISCNHNLHNHVAHPDRVLGEHDIIYIKEGNWQICQDDECYDLSCGDVILLQGNHHHYGLLPCDGIVKTYFVHFSLLKTDTLDELSAHPDCWRFPVVVNCMHNPMVEHYFKQIIYSFWSDGEHSDKKASAYLDLLLCELASVNTLNKSNSMIEDIKLEIKNTPDRFIRVKDFADKYHFSERTISEKFKQDTGCGIHEWQMQLKCKMAEQLIRFDPTITLKEIAAIYGFYDEYHFGKCFKKILGYSPKKNK